MNKKELRSKYIKVREEIKEKEEKSKIIADKLLSFDVFNNVNTIGIYVSMKNEVDTIGIIEKLLQSGKKVCVPRIKEDGEMDFIYINSLNNMSKNKFGTLEPNDITKVVNPKDIDVMIMPGVCFDRYGKRIGFGKGYYDKYLIKNRNIKKVAIAFSEQVTNETIELEDYDIKYNYLITETEYICA